VAALISKKAGSSLESQGKHGRVKAICGAVVAVIAGIIKLSVPSSSIFFSGIPLPGSAPTLLGFVCLYPFTAAILAIFVGQILGSSTIRKLTQKPIEGIYIDLIVGIISGFIAAMLFLPLGAE